MAEAAVPRSRYQDLVREYEALAMAEATVPLSTFRELLREHGKLLREHKKLQQSHRDSLARLEKAKLKVNEARASVRKWQHYIDKHPKYVEGKGKIAPLKAPSPVSYALPAADVKTNDQNPSTAKRGLPFTGLELLPSPDCSGDVPYLSHDSSAPDLPDGSRTRVTHGAQGDAPAQHHPSSQTTDPGSDPQEPDVIRVKPEPDHDDEPVVVSSRFLKKQKPVEPMAGMAHRGTHSDPYKIKREDSEASQFMPHIPAFVSSALDTQASDLDTPNRQIRTPRKRQKISHTSDENLLSSSHDLNELISGDPQFADENTPPSSALNENTNISDAHDTRVQQPTSTNRHGSQTSTTSHPRSSGGPLQPLSTNTPILPRTSAIKNKGERLPRQRESLVQRLDDMGEDNTDVHDAGPPSARKGRRLDNLLQGNETPQNKNVIASRMHSSSTRAKQRHSSPATTPRMAVKETTPNPPLRSPKAPVLRMLNPPSRLLPRDSRKSDFQPPSDPRPDEDPLRSRPIARLGLDDFRINALYAGTDFAFNTSIRDRATRACLPGCTKACCATLQRFAGHANIDQSGSLTDEDEVLLKAWVGDEDTSMLSASQKQTLVATARAEKFARQHGRHRQVFERAKSPPGYWETDMPSTQDLEKHRKQAREKVRDEVRVRWVEAMKGGGRGQWRFKDEVEG
ncbi:hypothetical protein K461DRAFT_91064 [Myriangium duriaei CBS 260.36]|uniref:DNA endonuclease activator Ctp1 C-terminal domain-containing protein n=1 Tax=Myriangium duriaei CBS 260.36 TaxID=1168546 RepID=A0A9P4J7H9_9PEZI|nr:hypothetical protein K461DRAFT_91064 [Myriangium duriaei CBS 260.36]